MIGGGLVGDPATWDDASGVIRNGLTAATEIAGRFQWLFGPRE